LGVSSTTVKSPVCLSTRGRRSRLKFRFWDCAILLSSRGFAGFWLFDF
jgi:hypothetical protein